LSAASIIALFPLELIPLMIRVAMTAWSRLFPLFKDLVL